VRIGALDTALQPGARGRSLQSGRDRHSAERQAAAGMRARPRMRTRPGERAASWASRGTRDLRAGRAKRGRRWARGGILNLLDKDPMGIGGSGGGRSGQGEGIRMPRPSCGRSSSAAGGGHVARKITAALTGGRKEKLTSGAHG
jgi:hypothetical protein